MTEYYYVKEGERHGPFSFEDLKKENIDPSDLVWREGFDDWQIASEVEEIKTIFKVSPPPIPKDIKKPPPVKVEKTVEPPEVKPVETTIQAQPIVDPTTYKLSPEVKKMSLVAFGLTLFLIVFKLFISFAIPDVLNLIITTVCIIGVWFFLRKIILEKGEARLARRIYWVMGAYVVYGIINLVYIIGGDALLGGGDDIYFQVPIILMTIASIFVVIVAINLLGASSRLGGVFILIGLTSLLIVPIHLIFSTMGFLPGFEPISGLLKDEDKFQFNILFNFWYMMPYYFIAFQLFRSGKER